MLSLLVTSATAGLLGGTAIGASVSRAVIPQMAVQDKKVAVPVKKALKKNSGALTVSVEYGCTADGAVAEVEGDGVILSSQVEGAVRGARQRRRARMREGGVLTLGTGRLRARCVALVDGGFPEGANERGQILDEVLGDGHGGGHQNGRYRNRVEELRAPRRGRCE